MTLKDDLIAAKALIDTPRRWCKGSWNGTGGRHCAEGACLAVEETTLTCASGNFLAEFVPGHFASLPDYNDDKDTKHADIMALFDRAIEAAE